MNPYTSAFKNTLYFSLFLLLWFYESIAQNPHCHNDTENVLLIER